MELQAETVGFTATEMPSRIVRSKAYRILRRPHGVVKSAHRRFLVNSASEPVWYEVVIYRNRRWGSKKFELQAVCTCPAHTGCCHILAAGWTEHRLRTNHNPRSPK